MLSKRNLSKTVKENNYPQTLFPIVVLIHKKDLTAKFY